MSIKKKIDLPGIRPPHDIALRRLWQRINPRCETNPFPTGIEPLVCCLHTARPNHQAIRLWQRINPRCETKSVPNGNRTLGVLPAHRQA
jgi:hypothetical protein